jgi:membrane protein insertase Oxa1/YidC/SpoIIIJ
MPILALVAIALVVAACGGAPTGSPGASGGPSPTVNPATLPLQPVHPADPFSLLAWIFTPLFQAFFILLAILDTVTGNIAIAIILMTIIIRIILIPVFRRQTVSTKRTQMLAPEVKEIQRRFKGDRLKQQEAQRQLYAERGINPAAGCLPAILQIFLLIPMYSVFSQGLTNFNPQPMLELFGFRLI